MKRKKNILSCPFCGSKANLFVMDSGKKDGKKYYDIECTQCGAIMLTPKQHMLSDNKIDIIERWNHRV